MSREFLYELTITHNNKTQFKDWRQGKLPIRRAYLIMNPR